MEVILYLEKLGKRFGGLKAVDNVTLKVRKKEITLLIGPNGSGKTTLVNTATGYYKPDGGKVFFKNTEITGWPMHKVYNIGIVRSFQLSSPFQGLSVLGNILVAGKESPGESLIGGLHRKRWVKNEEEVNEKAFNVIKALDLHQFWDVPIASLSAGHLKLVEIGRALMADAEVVILDEPICGVNPALADKIFIYINKLKDTYGLTFLIIEHRLDIALKYADYVYVMNHGKVISEGDVEHIINDPQVRKVYIGE